MTRLIFSVLLYAFLPELLVGFRIFEGSSNGMDYVFDDGLTMFQDDDDEALYYDESNDEPASNDYKTSQSFSKDLSRVSDEVRPSSEEYEDDAEVAPHLTKSICRLPFHPGFCTGRFRAWGFDWKTKSCVPFLYHGCLGNANNFAKKKHCEAICVTGKTIMDSDSGLDDFDNPEQADGNII